MTPEIDERESDAMMQPETGRQRVTRELRRVVALRYPIIAIAFVCSAILSGGRGDWNYFVELGRGMLANDGLAFYRVNGDAQTGPIPLILAAVLSETPRNGFVAVVALCGAIGFATIVITERWTITDRGPSEARGLLTLTGGVVVAVWWGRLGSFGHLDDAAALGLAVLALRSHTLGQTRRSGIAVGLAIAFKPWAVFFLPLALARRARPGERHERWESSVGMVLACGFAAAAWLPFILAEPDSLRRLSPTVQLADDSALTLLGVGSLDANTGLRIAQLLLGTAVALVFVIARRPHAALPAAIAVRMLTDPGTWHYYTAGLVLVCVVWQFRNRDAMLPWLAMIVSVGLTPDYFVSDPTIRGVMRICTLVGVLIVMSLFSQTQDRRGTGDPPKLSGPGESSTNSSISTETSLMEP